MVHSAATPTLSKNTGSSSFSLPDVPTPLPFCLVLQDDHSVVWALIRRSCLKLPLKQIYWDKYLQQQKSSHFPPLLSTFLPHPSLLFQWIPDRNASPSSKLIVLSWSLSNNIVLFVPCILWFSGSNFSSRLWVNWFSYECFRLQVTENLTQGGFNKCRFSFSFFFRGYFKVMMEAAAGVGSEASSLQSQSRCSS